MFTFKKHAGQPSGQAAMTGKLETLRTQLAAMNASGRATQVGGEGATITATVSDDAPLPADKRAAIARDEHLVRSALKAVGVDYDALIATEAQEGAPSPYALAVQANPQVLKDVLAAKTPALKALEVAVGFKPYAEFTSKYGTDPAAIKAAIKAEALAESKPDTDEPKATEGLPFSRRTAGGATKATKAKSASLHDVFRK